MNRTRNVLIIAGALVVLIIITIVASRRGGPAATPVPTEKLSYSSFTVKLPENGTIMHPNTMTIPTLVAGNIEKIYAQAGERVSAGQLLATIQNPTIEYTAKGSSADYSNAVANVSTARINEQNAKVQYQASVDTAKSLLDEAERVYKADAALLADKAIARTTVDADKAKVDQAQVAYDQDVEQLKLGAVSGYGQSSVQAAQADAEAKQIANQQNQEQVAFLRITAPSSGIIQTVAANPNDPLRPVQPGDAVTAGQSLFTIADSTTFVVRTQVDEQDIVNVSVGQSANVTGQDFPGKTVTGRVAAIAPDAQKSTDASSTAKQVLTTINLDSSPLYLRDGMSADVDILTTDIPHALSVPTAAIMKDKGKSYIFLVDKGTVKKRAIVTGLAGDTQTLVTSGLEVGETIVSSNVPGLIEGAKVTPMPKASASPSP